MNEPSAFQASTLQPAPRRGDGGAPRDGIDKRALGLALLVHLLLLAALTWGVGWKRDTSLAVEAELWAAVPQEMAPVAQPAPPEPPPPTPPEPKPEPTPEPVEPPPPPPPSAQAQAQREAEINLEREREEQARKAEVERKARLEREQKQREQKERERKLAEEKRRKEEAERREREAAELREQLRQENIRRMAGLAEATPQPNAAGQATRTAGPSATYAGRIRARIKPNIVFPDNLSNTNISAEVKVTTSPDGAVTSRTLTKSSGNRLWDEAVLRAIDKTAILPKDTDGKVPPELIISFRPRD
ncbi:cell envelope integrity protein TolA [Hylemonella sp. W303a]|uniref:cell envelope integrity protein TolA n=1 Tax=Hylemonella sp. W303a TaxID=3389873 RepID=UPI00396B1135